MRPLSLDEVGFAFGADICSFVGTVFKLGGSSVRLLVRSSVACSFDLQTANGLYLSAHAQLRVTNRKLP